MLHCGKHDYIAGGRKAPTPGCKECHQVFFIHLFAKVPEDKRQERIELVEAMVNHLVEDLVVRGIPPNILPYPIVKFEKDALPD